MSVNEAVKHAMQTGPAEEGLFGRVKRPAGERADVSAAQAGVMSQFNIRAASSSRLRLPAGVSSTASLKIEMGNI
jgi:hypothetical protein